MEEKPENHPRLLQNPQNIQLRLELTMRLSSLRMLVTGTTKSSITNTQRAKLAACRVGSLAPNTFLTETELYTTTESPGGEPFAIDQRRFRDIFRVDNLTFGGSRWADWNPAFGRENLQRSRFGDCLVFLTRHAESKNLQRSRFEDFQVFLRFGDFQVFL